MSSFLGIDTSNYTTSVAVYSEKEHAKHVKRLLPVKDGLLGLRQSNAVFEHVKAVSGLISELMNDVKQMPDAIGVSTKPRDVAGSYMPCFKVGESVAKSISAVLKVPCYEVSHQSGHIVSALFSSDRIDLLNQRFLAFHVSGGTTEAVLVEPDEENIIKTEIVAKALDLNAGQLVDRVGKMLGLGFPSGKELEKLASVYAGNIKVTPSMKENDCNFSGIENICEKMKRNGESPEKIAAYCIEYIMRSIDNMCEGLQRELGELPLVFAGGVMSNKIISEFFKEKYNVIFAAPEFSADNAMGVAVLASKFYNLNR